MPKAIAWAIKKGVHIINLSLGFREEDELVKSELQKARKCNILVFASMNNSGNHEGARWPARDINLAIGIHGSMEYGVEACPYAGCPVPDNPNFMVSGENIPTRWPGNVEQAASGSSFATAIATSMAALILEFARQKLPKPSKEDPRRRLRQPEINFQKLQEADVMIRLLRKISRKGRGDFLWIHPHLLWKDMSSNVEAGTMEACRFAAEVIKMAL